MPGGFIEDPDPPRATPAFQNQFSPLLDGYRVEWESGVFRSVLDAFELCVENELPLPNWLKHVVMDELFYSYEHRPRGEKFDRRGMKQDLSNYRKVRRHRLMSDLVLAEKWEIALERTLKGSAITFNQIADDEINLTQLARRAEGILAASRDDARGSWRSILETYNAVKSGPE